LKTGRRYDDASNNNAYQQCTVCILISSNYRPTKRTELGLRLGCRSQPTARQSESGHSPQNFHRILHDLCTTCSRGTAVLLRRAGRRLADGEAAISVGYLRNKRATSKQPRTKQW